MNTFLAQIAQHGYTLLFFIVLAEAIGMPVPAALALAGGGAAVGARLLHGPTAFALALGGSLIGDSLLYVAGRLSGWTLLGILCRLAANPEACILRSAESFYKRGKVTLLIAKFVPGINSMAAPLAGSMKMRYWQFLRYDLAGATLYVLSYGLLGFLFRDFLTAIRHGYDELSHVFSSLALAGFAAYFLYRIWLYKKNSVFRVVPRVPVQQLAELQAQPGCEAMIVDVRSHGYYDSNAQRIKGSIRIEPNNLDEEIKRLPKDKDIYLYCT
jgi:membrane protein DedA with SNARE-associated domain